MDMQATAAKYGVDRNSIASGEQFHLMAALNYEYSVSCYN